MKSFLSQKQLFALVIFIGETIIPIVVGEPISVSTLAIKTGILLWKLRKPHSPAAKAEFLPSPPPENTTGLVTEAIEPQKAGRVSAFGEQTPPPSL